MNVNKISKQVKWKDYYDTSFNWKHNIVEVYKKELLSNDFFEWFDEFYLYFFNDLNNLGYYKANYDFAVTYTYLFNNKIYDVLDLILMMIMTKYDEPPHFYNYDKRYEDVLFKLIETNHKFLYERLGSKTNEDILTAPGFVFNNFNYPHMFTRFSTFFLYGEHYNPEIIVNFSKRLYKLCVSLLTNPTNDDIKKLDDKFKKLYTKEEKNNE